MNLERGITIIKISCSRLRTGIDKHNSSLKRRGGPAQLGKGEASPSPLLFHSFFPFARQAPAPAFAVKVKELAEQIQGSRTKGRVPVRTGGNEGGLFQGEAQALGRLRDDGPAPPARSFMSSSPLMAPACCPESSGQTVVRPRRCGRINGSMSKYPCPQGRRR